MTGEGIPVGQFVDSSYGGLMALQAECVAKAKKAVDDDLPAPAARWFKAAKEAAAAAMALRAPVAPLFQADHQTTSPTCSACGQLIVSGIPHLCPGPMVTC